MLKSTYEMVNSIWVKYSAERKKFGVKMTSYFGDEMVAFVDDVDLSFIFPVKPRPGITKMNISSQGVAMKIKQPFTISGDVNTADNGKETLVLRLHHQ